MAGWSAPVLTAAPPPASAVYDWNNVVIGGGGYVSGLVFHPTEPGLLYARTDVGGAYRYIPGESRWLPLNDDLGRNQAELTGIFSLALDPHDPERVYLAAGSYAQTWGDPAALLRSEDRGATWTSFPLPFKLGGNADGRNTGEHLLVHPDHGETLWLATPHDGLWRSDTYGETWQAVTAPWPEGAGLTLVFAGPAPAAATTPRLLYAALAEISDTPVLWQSADDGVTWTPLLGQPTRFLVHQAGFDPAGRLYFTYGNNLGPNDITAGACWRFDPTRQAWTNLTPALADGAAIAPHGFAGLAFDPTAPNAVIVTSLDRWKPGDQIWRSTDGGETWASLVDHATWDHSSAPYTAPFFIHWITDIAVDPHHPQQAWFVTGYGLWHTRHLAPTDDRTGPVWEFANAGLEETVIDELVSPPVGAPLLSAIGDIGGFRHDDLTRSPPAGTHAQGPGTSSTIDYAGGHPLEMVRTHRGPAHASRSHDGGRTWTPLASHPPEAETHGPGRVAISADAARMVWLPKNAGPYASDDGGASWQASDVEFTSSAGHLTSYVIADRVAPNVFYLSDPVTGRFFTSLDGGASFALTTTFAALGGIPRAGPREGGRVWVPSPRGLYVSTRPGRNFQRLTTVDAAYQIGFGHAAPGRSRDALYLHGRIAGREGIFRSDDSGQTWLPIDDPARRYGWLRVVIGDSQTYGRVYLGTSGRGIIVGEPSRP